MQGTALRMRRGRAAGRVRARAPRLRALLLRYAQAFHAQVAQTAACNGQHAVDERLARWLLMAHDRAGGDEFPVTPRVRRRSCSASRRAGISVAAGRPAEGRA